MPLAAWLTAPGDDVIAWRGSSMLTRHRWQQQVRELGQRLLSQPEQRWALCFEDSYLFSVALLATLHAGKTPVIPGHLRPSLLEEQQTEFDGAIGDRPLTLNCPLLTVPDPSDEPMSALPAVPADAAVILFTSGSTGVPRKVVKPVRCLDEEARWLASLWETRLHGCQVIASVSHQHLYGLSFRIILPLALGLPFDSQQIYYSEQLAARPAARYVLIGSPAFLRRIDFSLRPPHCQLVISAGGALAWDDASRVCAGLGQAVDEIYGSTETGVLASRRRLTERTGWQPFAGVALVQDPQQTWWARSPLIPQAAGLQLDDDLRFSGDQFQLCGRRDRIVKIEDKRISLSEIERRLLALPGIVDAAALQIARGGRSAIGVVLVLAAGGDDVSQLKRQWRSELQRWLEPVAIPRFWRVVAAIPHNSQSKRDWPQIQELFYVAR
ncbi:AMP-binding protein [Erwinia sp. B116]|uniref:AMP-binding protein n=1 Tax=Erwinia sp. B116 TaxID=1561024 RepID=UPI000CA83698|nr:AMP-binding protein [Erwinia sp. B116]PLV62212.1 AMP-binding protein [Erwinia sp. B116]